mmetsp:Transcript_21862/g.85644  ORF Transcript_21862/g.85644 Transcript_21862/m.85644 type:complete len:258 (+) Transcript_21862:1286-2059(+)
MLRENQNVLPLPSCDSTPTSPFMSFTSFLQMARPRPEPSNLRVVLESSCEKGLKSSSIESSGTPMPESTTSKRTWSQSTPVPTSWHLVSSTNTRTITREFSCENLIAFETRFSSTWRRRYGSPTHVVGALGEMKSSRSMWLRQAGSSMMSTASSIVVRRLNSMETTCSSSASILEKSRMSLMIASSDSPELLIVCTSLRCSGLRSSFCSSNSVKPITALSGVRISWDMFMRKVLLARSLFWATSLSFLSRSLARRSS